MTHTPPAREPLGPADHTADYAVPTVCAPDCPHCAALAEDDLNEVEAMLQAVLARHDGFCVGEAIEDAFAQGHDVDETAWMVAAQLLDDGHSPCRCRSMGTIDDSDNQNR